MAKDQPQGYSFILTKIEIIEKKLNTPINPDTIKGKFLFDIALQVAEDASTNDCIYKMKVNIKSNSDGQEDLATIVLSCIFNIPKYKELISSSDKNSLPKDLIYLLNTVVIGTMRGVMFTEFRGTYLHDAYLPVLDPSRFEVRG